MDVHIFKRGPNVSWTKVSSHHSDVSKEDPSPDVKSLLSTDLACSIAPAEITLAFAYIFRNYKLALPEDHKAPQAIDRFTLQYKKPGSPIIFRRRQA